MLSDYANMSREVVQTKNCAQRLMMMIDDDEFYWSIFSLKIQWIYKYVY